MDYESLKGIKEYLPKEQEVREYITDILKRNFKKYGFRPLETSILESYEIASSKYSGGEEILKETYKLTDQGKRKLCLRYELTFKLGKLIAENPNLKLPLKRYEIGKVFRDGPVKTGRLREFTQCDVDVVGIENVAQDAEFISMSFDVFKELNLPIYIQINNRKLLFGIFKELKISEKEYVNVALSLDKLEKVGEKEVKKELIEKKINKNAIDNLFNLLNETNKQKDNLKKLDYLKKNCENELFLQGYNELKDIFDYVNNKNFIFVPTLSRGLGYYTGPMWEVYLQKSKVKSSIAAGGRWNNMIKNFLQSERDYPATGMTFGLDVIYTALTEDNIEIKNFETTPKIMIIALDELKPCIELANSLRQNNINTSIAFDQKLSKALDYANKESIPYTMIIGKKEIESKIFGLKDMNTGKTQNLKEKEVIKKLKV